MNGSSFGKLEEKVHELTYNRNGSNKPKQNPELSHSGFIESYYKNNKKAGAFILFNLLSHNKKSVKLRIFNYWKFWIYKKSKLQEELEIKLQQTFTQRTETLNELKSCSKKYFSQLLTAISSVNYQKPLEIELSSCELSKEWLDLLLQSLENNSYVSEVIVI